MQLTVPNRSGTCRNQHDMRSLVVRSKGQHQGVRNTCSQQVPNMNQVSYVSTPNYRISTNHAIAQL